MLASHPVTSFHFLNNTSSSLPVAIIPYINKSLLKIGYYLFSNQKNANPYENPSIDDIRKFLEAFIKYQEYLNKFENGLDEIKKKLLNELKEQGIEL